MTDENNALKEKEQVEKAKKATNATTEKRKSTTRKSTSRKNYRKKEEKDLKEVKIEEKTEKKKTSRTRSTRGTRKTETSKNQDIFKKSKLKIIPLGGLHEIGKNITVFEYEDEIIVVDCGLSFPEDDMLGVDLVIPDITY